MSATVQYLHDGTLNVESLSIVEPTSSDSLQIQRALELDDQDVELGMDTYCIVRDSLSHYGGLLAWRLGPDTLTLRLEPGAAAALQLPQEIVVSVSPDGFDVVLAHLAKLSGVEREGAVS